MRRVLVLATVAALVAAPATCAFAGAILAFDLYTSAVFAGTGNSATCRAVNAGATALDVLAHLVDVNGNILAAGLISIQPQHNGAVTGKQFADDFASVYCRFKVSHKLVRASLTLENGFFSAADTIAVAEGR